MLSFYRILLGWKTHKCCYKIPTKVIVDGLKRNMSRGNSLSDELDLGSVLGDTELICIVPFWGSYSEPNGNSS